MDDVLEAGDRFFVLAGSFLDDASDVVGGDQFGIELFDAVQGVEGLFIFGGSHEGQAEVEVILG